MYHPVTELKQPNGQTHEKASHQKKEQGQTTMWSYALEMKDPMLMSQTTPKQNSTNNQVSIANEIQ